MSDTKTISTGVPSVDYATGGFRTGELIVISGRPSMGKTNFGLRMLVNSSPTTNGCYISLELSGKQVIQRIKKQNHHRRDSIIVEQVNASNPSIRVGFEKASSEVVHFKRLNIFNLGTFVEEKLQSARPPAYFIIDYLGLMQTPSDGLLFGQKIGELKAVLQELKAIASHFKVCIIALTQVSRVIERPPFRGLPTKELCLNYQETLDMLLYLYRWDYYGLDFDETELREVKHGEVKAMILHSIRPVNDWEPIYHDAFDLV